MCVFGGDRILISPESRGPCFEPMERTQKHTRDPYIYSMLFNATFK